MMKFQQPRILLATLGVLMLGITLLALAIHAQEGDRVAGKFLNNVVQLTTTLSDGSTEHGFGFIVGERGDTLYVATANHVVRTNQPDVSTQEVQVRFYADRGKAHSATLLDLAYPGLDLALLEIEKPFPEYVWETCCVDPDPNRGDLVWFIGRNQDWWIPPDQAAGSIIEPPSFVKIQFPVYLPSVLPGTSGTPLISAAGILGMIIEDSSEEAIVLSIKAISDVVGKEWGYPWGLEEFQPEQVPEPAATPLPQPTPVAGEERRDPVSGIDFVWVPDGCFQMGQTEAEKKYLLQEVGEEDYKEYYERELPRHKVCIKDGFWMGKYEVTQGQWFDMMGDNPAYFNQNNIGKNWRNHPVEQVSWNDAQKFIKKLNENAEQEIYRLPSEAEWEYATRAGTITSRFWGDNMDEACDYANVYDLTAKKVDEFDWPHHECDDDYAGTAPIGEGRQNEFGLHDMLGNVWEWTADTWHSTYDGAPTDGGAWEGGDTDRVIRGGGWNSHPVDMRSAIRGDYAPEERYYSIGFRLLRTF